MPNHLTVDGFPQSFTDENLKEVFTLYGHVLTATIIYRIPSYRYGLVAMATMAEAERAVGSG
jgi:hypothetical protein